MKTIVEYLNEIANLLGDDQPDKITTQAVAYEHIIKQMEKGEYFVTYSASTNDLSTFTNVSCDKTYDEILDAISNGKKITAYADILLYGINHIFVLMTQYSSEFTPNAVELNGMVHMKNNNDFVHFTASITHNKNGTVAIGLSNS